MRVELVPAFILHQHAYRESSVILDILTQDYGRISAIVKGIRGNRRKPPALLQPYSPLLISWTERHSSLYLLTSYEAMSPPYILRAQASLCGLYVNELLVRLLPPHSPDPSLFMAYQHLLGTLQCKDKIEIALRLFEKRLLSSLGYGLSIEYEADTQQAIIEQAHYIYQPDRGLFLSKQGSRTETISGRSLRHLIDERNFDKDSLKEIKQLMRRVLHFYLDGKPLQSRTLFSHLNTMG